MTTLLMSTLTMMSVNPVADVTIPEWSTTKMTLHANGRMIKTISKSEKLDLGPWLRPGDNTVEIRYDTRDGKISRKAPSILRIVDRNGKELMKLKVWEDNPRGTERMNLIHG